MVLISRDGGGVGNARVETRASARASGLGEESVRAPVEFVGSRKACGYACACAWKETERARSCLVLKSVSRRPPQNRRLRTRSGNLFPPTDGWRDAGGFPDWFAVRVYATPYYVVCIRR